MVNSALCRLADNSDMESEEGKYEKEPELHKIFDQLMQRFDEDPEADLTPQIDNLESFLALYNLQGKPGWLHFYESKPWDLIRFILGGSEAAFGLDTLPEEMSAGDLTRLLEKLDLADRDPKSVKPDLIDDSIKLKAIQLFLVNRCFRVNYVCMLQYKIPISFLILEAMAGDIDSFLDLVKLDSSFLYSEYGIKNVSEAELSNDDKFKMALADALEPDPAFWSLKGKRNHYMLLTLSMLDDYVNRSDKDWADFFAAHDIEKYSDVTNVRMQRKRYNLSRPTTP